MAKYTFRAHKGLTGGMVHLVRADVEDLVKQAASGVGWNRLGAAPSGFTMTEVDGKMKPIHTRTAIAFKPGFQMYQASGSQKWEGHATTTALRLDLQCIANGWANWAVQTNGKNSVTIATCLMKLDECFSQGQLAQGLIQSADQTKLCELTQ